MTKYIVKYYSKARRKDDFVEFASKSAALREASLTKRDPNFKNVQVVTGLGKPVAAAKRRRQSGFGFGGW